MGLLDVDVNLIHKNLMNFEEKSFGAHVNKVCENNNENFKIIDTENFQWEIKTDKNKESEKETFIVITGPKSKDIQHLYIPKEIKGMPVAVIDNNAFENCKNLKTIKIEDGALRVIKKNAFRNCISLEEFNIPFNEMVVIENNAFGECTSLHSIGMTLGHVFIDKFACEGCLKLEKINGLKVPNNDGKVIISSEDSDLQFILDSLCLKRDIKT